MDFHILRGSFFLSPSLSFSLFLSLPPVGILIKMEREKEKMGVGDPRKPRSKEINPLRSVIAFASQKHFAFPEYR